MSGTSVYTAPANNAGSKSSSASSGSSAGSVVGTLLVGAMVIPVGIAAVCAIGLAKGIGALGKLGIKAYKKHRETQAKNEEYRREMAEKARTMMNQLQSTNADFKIPQKTVSPQTQALLNEQKQQLTAQSVLLDRFAAQQTAAFSAMEQHLQGAVSDSAKQYNLPKLLAEQTQTIFKNWKTDFSQLRTAYTQNIETKLKAGAALLAKYQSMLTEAQNLKADRAKYQTAMQEIAQQAISDAETLLENLAGMPGAAIFYDSDLALYRNAYTDAAQSYARKDYDAAFSRANDLLVHIQETTQDLMQKLFYSQMEKDRLLARVAVLDEALRGMKDMHYQKDGKTYAVDLTGFMPDGFAAAGTRLRALTAALASDTPMTTQELERAQQALNELEIGISSVETTARRRLESVEQSLCFCSDIMPAMKAQNFSYAGSAFDNNRTLHVNFHNQSGVDVTLLICHENGGRLKLEMEYFDKGKKADPMAQKALLRAICNQTGISMTCMNPGESSVNRSAGDLEQVRKDCQFPVPILRRL